jgi:hypothetical protein
MGGIAVDGRNGELIQSVVEMIVQFYWCGLPKTRGMGTMCENESSNFRHARGGNSAGIFTRGRVGDHGLNVGGDADEGVCCGCETGMAELFGPVCQWPRSGNVDSGSGRGMRWMTSPYCEGRRRLGASDSVGGWHIEQSLLGIEKKFRWG